jgi:glycosyltransferase involved in cell wall biosynthesis
MVVTIAHDYCTQRGGAERVALTLLEAFPHTELVTALHNGENTFGAFDLYSRRTSALQRWAPFRRDPRTAFPLLASAWGALSVTDSPVVVCSSSGWSHGVTCGPGVKKVVYCHNPARWLYQAEDYFRDQTAFVSLAARRLAPSLRRWDLRAAQTANLYIANSTIVARRIEAAYGIEPTVVNPPGALDPRGAQEPIDAIEPGFLLSVGRGRGYKHTDIVASAVSRYGKYRLVVVGGYDGVESFPNVTRVNDISDAKLRWLYANAAAVVSLSHEDFGLTPVEGFGFGTPAAVLRGGGFLDSMIEGVTGVFADAPTETAFIEALERLPGSYDTERIREHAQRFSPEVFQSTIRGLVSMVTSPAPAGVRPAAPVSLERDVVEAPQV